VSTTTTSRSRTHTHLLDAMAAELELINRGDAGGRLTETGSVAASRLACAINASLDRRDTAEDRARFLLEEQSHFSADAAHALRTPVAALRAELEEARLHPDPTDLDGLLSRTLTVVGRLQEVVEELQLLARPSAFALEAGRRGERLRRSAPR
jgi:signal transduction histidine kinase